MSFRVEDYVFSFNQNRISVGLGVKKLNGADMTEEDKKIIQSYLEDMGKWEKAIESVSQLLNEIGLVASRPAFKETYQAEFGKIRYDIHVSQKPGSLNRGVLEGNIDLTYEERERRRLVTKASPGQDIQLTVDEVEQQAKNVLKWRSLKKFLSWL